MPETTLAELLECVRRFTAAHYPGRTARRVVLLLDDGDKIALPVGAGPPPSPPGGEARFVPTAFQIGILDALHGKALRTDALGAAVGDRSRLFKRNGLAELREKGMVAHHERRGFYRPDSPPEELDRPGRSST